MIDPPLKNEATAFDLCDFVKSVASGKFNGIINREEILRSGAKCPAVHPRGVGTGGGLSMLKELFHSLTASQSLSYLTTPMNLARV